MALESNKGPDNGIIYTPPDRTIVLSELSGHIADWMFLFAAQKPLPYENLPDRLIVQFLPRLVALHDKCVAIPRNRFPCGK